MDTDEQGILTEAAINSIIQPPERNDLWQDYRRVAQAQHDHDVALIKVFLQGKPDQLKMAPEQASYYAAIEDCLSVLGVKPEKGRAEFKTAFEKDMLADLDDAG